MARRRQKQRIFNTVEEVRRDAYFNLSAANGIIDLISLILLYFIHQKLQPSAYNYDFIFNSTFTCSILWAIGCYMTSKHDFLLWVTAILGIATGVANLVCPATCVSYLNPACPNVDQLYFHFFTFLVTLIRIGVNIGIFSSYIRHCYEVSFSITPSWNHGDDERVIGPKPNRRPAAPKKKKTPQIARVP